MASELESRFERFRSTPGDRAQFYRLVTELRQAGRDELLSEAFELHAGHVSDSDAVRLHLTVAERLSQHAPERAERNWAAAFHHAWDNRDLFVRMETDASQRDVESARRNALAVRVARDTDAGGRARALRSLALLETEAGRWDSARQAWMDWGAQAPSHAAEALEQLEGLRSRGPSSLDVDSACEGLARSSQDQRSLLRLMDGKLARLKDASGREFIDASLEVASLALAVSGDLGTGLDYLYRLLERIPQSAADVQHWVATRPPHELDGTADGSRFLRHLAQTRGDWTTALAWIDHEATLTTDTQERAELLIERGDLQLQRLQDPAAAVASWTQAALLWRGAQQAVDARLEQMRTGGGVEGGEQAFAAQRSLLERRGDWAAVHALIRGSLSGAGGANAARWLELGELELQHLGRPDLALRSLSRAATLGQADVHDRAVSGLFDLLADPGLSDEAAVELAPILSDRGRWTDFVRLRRRQIEHAQDSAIRAQLHAEIARIQETELQRPAEAAQAWARAAELRPDEVRYQDEARRLLVATGNYEQALDVVRREAAHTPSVSRRVELLAIESRILLDHMGDPGAALDAAYEAFAHAPSDPSLLGLMDHLLAGEPTMPGLVRGLALGLVDRNDPAGAQFILWVAARRIGLVQDDGAACGLAAAQVMPMDVDRLHELERAIRTRSVSTEQLAMARLLAPVEPDSSFRLTLYREMAALHRQLGDLDQAAASLRHATALSSNALVDRLALIDVLEVGTDADSLASALEAVVDDEELSPDDQLRYLQPLAELLQNQLGESDQAYDRWRQVLALDPNHERAMASVAAIAAVSGDARRMYDAVLQTLDDISDADEIARRRIQLADIASGDFEDPDLESRHLSLALQSGSESVEVNEIASSRLLDGRFDLDDVETPVDGLVLATLARVRWQLDGSSSLEFAADRLDALRQHRRWREAGELASTLVAQVPALDPVLLDLCAQTAIRLGDTVTAANALRQWRAAEAPMPVDRLALLTRIEWPDYADTAHTLAVETLRLDPDQPEVLAMLDAESEDERVAAIAEALSWPEARVEHLYRAAAIHQQLESDPSIAAALWKRIVDIDGTQRAALDLLVASLRERGLNDDLRAVLSERIDASTDEAERSEFYASMAELATSDSEREDFLRKCAAADLTDLESRQGLAAIYLSAARWSELADITEELGGLESEPAARVARYRTLSQLCLEHLDNMDRAVASLELLLEVDPNDESGLRALEGLYRRRENWAGVASIVDRRASLEQDLDARLELLRDLATIHEQRLSSPEAAVGALERILSLEPANFPILEEVARIHAAGGQWEQLLRTLERMAGASSIRELQAEVFVRAARTMHEQLDRHRDALELLATAAATASPTSSLIELVRSAGHAADLPVALAGVLRTIAARVGDADLQLELELEVATLLDSMAHDASAALVWLKSVFARDARPGIVMDRIEALAARAGLLTETTDVYRQLLAEAGDNAAVRWHALHQLSRIALTQPDGAVTAFGLMVRAAESDELREQAEAELERIASEHSLYDQHREYLLSVSQDAADEAGQVAMILRKAQFEETQMNNWEEAFDTLVDAFQDRPSNPALRRELYRLSRTHGAWDVVFKLYELLAASTTDVARKVTWLLELATLCEQETMAPVQGLAYTIRAWYERPDDEELRALTEQRARANDRMADLLAAWEWYVEELVDDPATRLEALDRVVALATELGATERALAAWSSVFEYRDRAEAALQECDEWLSARGERAALGDTIAMVFPQLPGADLKVLFLVRRADVAEEFGDVDAAMSAWSAAIAQKPQDLGLRRQQVDTLLRLQKPTDAAVALQELTGLTKDATERGALRLELAGLLTTTLDAPVLAIRSLTQLLDSDPLPAEAEDQIVALYRDREDWNGLVAFLQRRAESARDVDRRVKLLLRCADVLDENCGDPRRALRTLDELGAESARLEAQEIRARLLANLGQWTEHVDVLLRIADAHTDAHSAAVALGQAADALENQLVYVDRAVDAWRKALARDPDYLHASAQLGRLLSELGADTEAREILEAAWEAVESGVHTGQDAADVCVLLSALTDVGAESSALRLRMLQVAVEVYPRHPRARELYELELERSGGVERLLQLLDEELQSSPDERSRSLVLVKRAAALFFDGNREPEARKTLKRAQEMVPGLVAASALLGDMEVRLQRWSAALDAYRAIGIDPAMLPADAFVRPRRLGQEELMDDRVGALYAMRLGEVLEHTGQPDEAYEVYTGILLDDETYPPALAALARLSLVRDNLAGAAVHIASYMRYASLAPRALTARVNMVAAEVAEREGHSDTAMHFYDRATRDIDVTGSRQAVERSAEMALKSGDAALAVPRLQKLLELAEGDDDRARILIQLGVAQSEVEPAAGAESLRTALTLLPPSSPDVDTALHRMFDTLSGEERINALSGTIDVLDGEKQARARLMRAHALMQESRVNEACDDASSALLALPWSSAALDLCVDSHQQAGRANTLSSTLSQALQLCPADASGGRAALLAALANTQWDHDHDALAAMATWRQLQTMQPDNVAVLESILKVSNEIEDIDLDEVLNVSSELVRLGALSEDLLRALQQVHYDYDNIDGVLQALQVLKLANAATNEELKLLGSLPSRLPAFGPSSLSDELYERFLLPSGMSASTASVIRAASAAWLDEQPPVNLDALGQPVPSGLEITRQFETLCEAFGRMDIDLLMDAELERPYRLVAGLRPALVVSSVLVAEKSPQVLRFLLARALAQCRPEFLVLQSLSALDALGFFEAAIARVTSGAQTADPSLQRVIERWSRKLASFVPPADVARASREQFMAVSEYRVMLESLGIRTGVVASFDSTVAFDMLLAETGESAPNSVHELRSLCDQHSSIRSLITWLLSDTYLAIRRELGLTVAG